MNASPNLRHAFTLSDPGSFLGLVSGAQELDLGNVALAEMWALAGIGALARSQRRRPLRVSGQGLARQFALAVGLDDVMAGRADAVAAMPDRTVRLATIHQEDEIEPAALRVAQLLTLDGQEAASARLTLKYVLVEMLRNVLQHSGDLLGGVVGAQLNDRGLHEEKPVYQMAVADTGIGVRRHLARLHREVTDDRVALERALWPFMSGAFEKGRSGGLENAGLGLFFISEMAKRMGGRFLLASMTSAVLIDPSQEHRHQLLHQGFPGTLVAFEIPVRATPQFDSVFDEINAVARERAPRRRAGAALRLDAMPPAGLQRFLIAPINENNAKALALAADQLIPRLQKKEPVVLDFLNVTVCTQSYMHALLRDALRQGWASETPIYAVNANPVVRSALELVNSYALGG